jgi:methionyl-tRNA synthetase
MYVWFDALTSYISTLDWPEGAEGDFKKFWEDGKTLQVAGKDQVRFQSLMWQAMLMSADIKNTDTVFYHGFITSGGQKMSKSLGNVINPLELVQTYGTDAVRYILLRHLSPVEDSDLILEAIHDHYTAHLTNGLGNLVARVMKLAETHLSEPVECPEISFPPEYTSALQSFEFNHVMDLIWAHITALDERITSEQPFAVVKEDLEKGKVMIRELIVELHTIGVLLSSFMPKTSEIVKQAVRENKKPENIFPRL